MPVRHGLYRPEKEPPRPKRPDYLSFAKLIGINPMSALEEEIAQRYYNQIRVGAENDKRSINNTGVSAYFARKEIEDDIRQPNRNRTFGPQISQPSRNVPQQVRSRPRTPVAIRRGLTGRRALRIGVNIGR